MTRDHPRIPVHDAHPLGSKRWARLHESPRRIDWTAILGGVIWGFIVMGFATAFVLLVASVLRAVMP